ncbi:MAG TPA: BMP family ABC transporter substrate-binding protein [Anaerolineales bacterium]|nr:BMP family ABC transporter substrate-binding protein [Anaerolineales bacterium]
MRRKSTALLSRLLLGAAVFLGACGRGAPSGTPEGEAATAKVCLVTDTKGLDDRAFNDTAWQGVAAAEDLLRVQGDVVESALDTDYARNINTFIESGCDLIVTVGTLIGQATAEAAQANPDQKFAIVDFDFVDASTDPPTDLSFPNVREITFQSDQGAFLVGYLAAGMTETGKVGTFGGVAEPSVIATMDGFVLGVAYYNERHGTAVEAIGWDPVLRMGLFTNTFDDVLAGLSMAEDLHLEGVDILMPVARGSGLGAAAAAMERGGGAVIGVDNNWAISAPEYAEVMLTSVLKRMDVAVLETATQLVEGTFRGGTYIGNLANGGLELAPFQRYDALIPDELKVELQTVKADIIAGLVSTNSPP